MSAERGAVPALDLAPLVARLGARGLSLAVAESLTAGLVCSRLGEVPGVSAVLRGGVVAYATDVKAGVLGVDADLLSVHGPVHPQVAAQMATGVARLLGADVGLATTGVAGPDPQGGHPAGTVYVALTSDVAGLAPARPGSVPEVEGEASGSGILRVQRLQLPGGRQQVRAQAAAAVLSLLADALR